MLLDKLWIKIQTVFGYYRSSSWLASEQLNKQEFTLQTNKSHLFFQKNAKCLLSVEENAYSKPSESFG